MEILNEKSLTFKASPRQRCQYAAVFITFQIMNNRFKLGAVLLAAAGTFTVAGAAPANAAACPNASPSLSTLIPLAFSCDQGGFTFNFN